jgi:hypothetical protein
MGFFKLLAELIQRNKQALLYIVHPSPKTSTWIKWKISAIKRATFKQWLFSFPYPKLFDRFVT